MSDHDLSAYLGHVVLAMDTIAEYVAGMTADSFYADRKTQDAVVRNCEIIGEAMKHVPDDYRRAHPEVDWRGLAGLRDVLIHQYFGVDYYVVWEIATTECPVYRQVIAALPEYKEPPETV